MNGVINLCPKPRTEWKMAEGEIQTTTWLGRFAKWLLSKTKHLIRMKYSDQVVDYVEVDLNKLDSVIQCRLGARQLQHIWGGEVERIVVGQDIFDQIVDRESLLRPFNGSFMVERELGIGRAGGDFKVCGIPVQFVPWMKGFFLLPKAS